MTFLWAYLSGAGAVLVLWLIAGAFAGAWDLLRLAEGQDGRLSVSKLQWLLWTMVVVFGYVATLVARGLNGGDVTGGISLPSNLLIAMGFSTATMVTAKGITTLYVAQGRVVKPPVGPAPAAPAPAPAAVVAGAVAVPAATAQPPATSFYSDLVQDDSNQTDLSKVQLLIWTAIALGAFLTNVILNINAVDAGGSTAGAALPDIDGALMVLMGLSQGGYLGKKLVTSNRLQLISLAPPAVSRSAAGAATRVTLLGSGFGPASPANAAAPEDTDSKLLLDSHTPAWVVTWSDSRIVFAVDPANDPTGQPWAAGAHDIGVTVLVSGQVPRDAQSSAPQSLTLTVSP